MNKHKLLRLIKKEEGPKLDFKEELHLITESDKKELTKDVIAMANSRGGRGYIIFGVADKTKKIVGIDPGDFKEEQIQQIIYNRCDPPVPISVEFLTLEDKKLAVLTVYKSIHQPHQMMQTGAFYVRRGSTTDTARRNEIANMFQENGLMSYETIMLRNAGLDKLDYNLLNKYFSNLNVISEKPSEILLESMGIAVYNDEKNEYNVTFGGILVFGKNPELFFPHAQIKVSYHNQSQLFYGNILKLLDDVSSYLRQTLKIENYPFQAVEEALANALVHRDYLDNSRGITVKINDRSIEISNPGAMAAGNVIGKFFKESQPIRRNAWLYQRLLILDDKKRFLKSGIGISRIKNAFTGMGDVKFVNIGSRNLFKVILPI